MTCQHKPFLANNGQVSQAWDSCMGPGMNTTIDSGIKLLSLLVYAACKALVSLTSDSMLVWPWQWKGCPLLCALGKIIQDMPAGVVERWQQACT